MTAEQFKSKFKVGDVVTYGNTVRITAIGETVFVGVEQGAIKDRGESVWVIRGINWTKAKPAKEPHYRWANIQKWGGAPGWMPVGPYARDEDELRRLIPQASPISSLKRLDETRTMLVPADAAQHTPQSGQR